MSVYALDFEYDGNMLSDMKYLICDFDYSSGVNTSSNGSLITFNLVSRNMGKKYSKTSSIYEECIQAEFDICKDPDENDDMIIDDHDYRALMKWLNRHKFLPFRFLGADNKDGVNENVVFMSSFNIEKIKIAERLYGLHLTMTTNAPHGYGADISQTLSVSGTSGSTAKPNRDYISENDEYGLIYPKFTITCKGTGNLRFQIHKGNSHQNEYPNYGSNVLCAFDIENCTNGEIITIDSEKQIISTSLDSHKLYNDFNFAFPCFINYENPDVQGESTDTNTIVNNGGIAFDISYTFSPIIKVSP